MPERRPTAADGPAPNADPAELRKFAALSATWWDPNGASRALHDLNPVRLDFVRAHARVAGARVCDVGCGGGLLSEALAAAGASVVAIDRAPEVLAVARLHLHVSGLDVDYRETDAESLAAAEPAGFDTVTCMELIEHVPDPGSLLRACAALLKPGGRLLVSTINRTPLAFAAAIVGAEYVAGLLPKGTHRYERFLKPSELARGLRAAGLDLVAVRGLGYEPVLRRAWLASRPWVNYIACAERPA